MEKNTKSKGSTTSKAASAKPTAIKQSSVTTNGSSEDSSMLEKFVLDSVKDIYWAEKHLLKALPKLNKAATSPQLKQVFTNHLAVTQEQIARLEQVFEMMGKKAQAKKCDAMEGLTKEAEGVIEETEAGTKTRDVALIMAAQKVEHYEIATYGSLVQITKTLGKNEISDIFAKTLAEEKEADELLTGVAENNINFEAISEVDKDAEEED
ncbi:MAG: ferritin-like domain-containing protein [Chitinophagaceae bacterium]